MKGSFFSHIEKGLLIFVILLQAVSFASTNTQYQNLQNQITKLSQKYDDLQLISDGVLNTIIKLRNESAINDVNQKNLDQILELYDPNSENLLSSKNLSQTLGSNTNTFDQDQTIQGNSLKLKPGWDQVDAYESQKTSSVILGQIQTNITYPIIQKQSDWYQINLGSQTSAWVQSQFVYETN